MMKPLSHLALTCVLIGGCAADPPFDNLPDENTLLIFHNNSGSMCLAALEWLEGMKSQYPDLVVEEHLVFEPDDLNLLEQLEARFDQSEGVSTTFGFLPIIFFHGRAFSGFDDEVQEALTALIGG